MKVTIPGGFWSKKRSIVSEISIPYQWKVLGDQIDGAPPSYALQNLRIASGECTGTVQGFSFQDTDVAKWLEAASYSLCFNANTQLEVWMQEAIRLIGAAQRDDGYINSHFLSKEQQEMQGIPHSEIKDRRWEDLKWGHELYTAGHLIEAGTAHYAATGKKDLLAVVSRLADCLVQTFGKEEGKKHMCCGHPEIELALFRLFEATGNESYKDLALYFLDIRGTDPAFFARTASEKNDEMRKWLDADYFAAHEPVRKMRTAAGHAVRAVYLYEAMADAVYYTGDEQMKEALFCLWDNIVSKQMYITGGIGSQGHGERFTIDYDLPNGAAYTETCASIGLFFLASKMFRLHKSSVYADIAERVLYNGLLSGISLDGTRYFYVNPLEVIPETAEARQDHMWVKKQRVPWFGCACCPPNIARLITSIDRYLYAKTENAVYFQHYAESELLLEEKQFSIGLKQKTRYPWEGDIFVRVDSCS
ncbi:MAG: glycoside hydrolase family 127 protein, partial [Spirochaetaceae bacterium]|nr:glycoside hydrolase family 127 protein [Spirochaetaceae bacterium]